MGPLLFLICINDFPELCASQDDSSKLYLYADDAKIFKAVSQITDQLDLQAIMNTVKTWSDEWLLRLNIDKCKTLSYYFKNPLLDTQYHIMDGNTTRILEKLNSINDLGVIFAKGAQQPPLLLAHVYCGHGRPCQLLLSSCLHLVYMFSQC